MSARSFALAGVIAGVLIAGAMSVSAFDDRDGGGGFNGTFTSAGYLDGYSLCLGGDATGHCVGALGAYWEAAYNEVPYLTISSTGDIATGGDLTLTSGGTITTTSNGDITLNANGTGITNLQDKTIIDDGTSTWTYIDGAGDLGVEDELEVGGLSYFSGGAKVGSALTSSGVTYLGSAETGAVFRQWGGDQLVGLGSTTNRNIVFTAFANRSKDHGHALHDDAHLIGHSALDPTTVCADATVGKRYWSIHHDGTSASAGNATLATGAGGIVLDPDARYVQLPTVVDASPSEPGTCAVGTFGMVTIVNDSDDTAGSQVCYCGMTDDSTYDWLDMSDNTACDHF